MSSRTAPQASPPGEPARAPSTRDLRVDPPLIAARKRVALRTGLLVLVLFLAYPVVCITTPALDGTLLGIGVAYLVGAAEVVLAMVVATLYCRWADRQEDLADTRAGHGA